MARIRTVKPDFFRHEALQDLEAANPGACPMLVFMGLWCTADREGRFEWRPRRIKLDVLPFLDFDLEATLSLLVEGGFLSRYQHQGEWYGQVCAWDRHQIPGRDEPPSEIPAEDGAITPYFRPLSQTQRLRVYERDGWRCLYCERDLSADRRAACLDHVIPYSKNGTNREANLATACKRCNAKKADRDPQQAGMSWPQGLGERVDDALGVVRQQGLDEPINDPSTGGPAVPDKERGREGKGKERRVAADAAPHPAWLPPEWEEFEQHRREKRATLTPTARKGCIAKLERWRAAGHDVKAILRYTIDNGYTGLFEPKAVAGTTKADLTRWWKSDDGISAKAKELGVHLKGQGWPMFKAQVFVAAGEGPWIDERDGTTFRLVREIRKRAK